MDLTNVTAAEELLEAMLSIFPIIIGLSVAMTICMVSYRIFCGSSGEESSDDELSDYEKDLKELRGKVIN